MVANINEKTTTSKKELVISIFFALLFIGLVGTLIGANLRINARRDEMIKRIDQLKTDIKTLEDKNKQLNNNLNQASASDRLEKVAREQLGLKKPGEEVVVINNPNTTTENTAGATPQTPTPAPKKSIWNPLNWWSLLTGK